MNILKLKYFIDIVNFGSFSKAATHNYISQAAISQHISSMENELGFSLFNRCKSKVILTSAGETFYTQIAGVYAGYNQAVRIGKQIADENNGHITIGVVSCTRMDYMTPILQNFHQDFPNVEIRFEQLNFSGLRSALQNGEIDCVISIRYNLEGLKHIKIRHLTALRMGLLVSRQNPLSRFDSVYVRDIKNEKLIMHTQAGGGGVYHHMINMRHQEGFEPNIMISCDSAEVMKLLVSMNMGSVYLPEVISLIDDRTCKMIRITDNFDYADYCIAYRETTKNSALESLVNRISEFFQNSFACWLTSLQDEIGWTFKDTIKPPDTAV